MKKERDINPENINPEYEDLIKQNKDLKKKNRELTQLNDELENQFSYMNIPIIIVNDDLQIYKFTSKAEEILHLDSKANGRPITDFMKHLEVPNLEDLILDVIKKGSLKEKKVQDQDGHWYALRFMPYRTIDKKTKGAMIVLIDIDSLMNAEQILRYKLSYLRHILDYMEDGVYIANEDFEIEYINPILKKEFGSPDGQKCFEYFHNRKTMCPWCKNREVLSGKTVRWEWYSPKTEKVYELIDAPLKNPDGSISKIVIFSDITERKKVEETLQENEKKFRQFIESMHEGIWVIDKDDVTIFVNPRMADLLGYNMDEMLYKSLFSFIEEQYKKQYRSYLDHCKQGIRETQKFEFIRKDGTKIYTRVELSETTDANGEYVGAVLYVMDITDLKRVESALKDSEARFFALAENSPNMIFINRMSRVMYANKKSEEILGYKKEELYSPYFDFFNIIAPESRESIRENFGRLMKGENINPFKFTFITKKDRRIDALLATEVIDDAGEKATLGIVTNSNTF